MNLDVIKRRLLELEWIEETEAVGIFGSLARGDFGSRSDINVFEDRVKRYRSGGI